VSPPPYISLLFTDSVSWERAEISEIGDVTGKSTSTVPFQRWARLSVVVQSDDGMVAKLPWLRGGPWRGTAL